MLTDQGLDEMERTFAAEAKYNCMGGMGLKVVAEVRRLQKEVREAKVSGIKLAAEVARDYDRLSLHGYLVSECILGKLNVLKRGPRRNPEAAKVTAVISSIEKKVDSVESMMRFMVGPEKWKKLERAKKVAR